MTPEAAKLWSKALERIPEEQLKFALNSAVDTLPDNATSGGRCLVMVVLSVENAKP